VAKAFLSVLEVVLGGNDIVVHTKVGNKVVFIVLVGVSLELFWGSCLGFFDTFWECVRVTSWD